MTSKHIAWVLGVVLIFALGIVAFFLRPQDKKVLAPETPNEVSKAVEKGTPVQSSTDVSSVMETVPTSDTSLVDITKNIEADMSYDQTAVDSDAKAELSSLEEGNATINDLGQTYDESKY